MDGLIKTFLPFLIGIISLLISQGVFPQNSCVVFGKVLDSSGQVLANAVISLADYPEGSIRSYALSKKDGLFSIVIPSDSTFRPVQLKAECNGYKPRMLYLKTGKGPCFSDSVIFVLSPLIKQLKEVVIKSPPLPFSVKGDTLEYNAKNYHTPEARKLQDLLGNIPGFQVSSEGKISFNGKEVEKILIEGEDLAERNYRLISRNLNSGWVNKIQVLNNYHDDRIMKTVDQSDKIGINLVIDEQVKNKLSGSITAGLGTGAGKVLDNNLILLTRKIKWLSILNYNNVGDLTGADLNYYFNQDLPANSRDNADQAYGLTIQTGKIYPPDLTNAYIRNNSDFSGAAIASWKGGAYTRMKMMAVYENVHLKNSGGLLQHIFLPDGQHWLMLQKVNATSMSKGLTAVFSLAHDRSKMNAGYLSLEASGKNQKENFYNQVEGIVSDSALENINNELTRLCINGFESWMIDSGKVFSMHYNFRYRDTEQDFNANTIRYKDFFLLDSAYNLFSQFLNKKTTYIDLDAGLYIRKRRVDYSLVWKADLEHNNWDARSNSANTVTGEKHGLADPSVLVNYQRQAVTAGYFYQVSRKNSVNSSVSLGYQNYNQTRGYEKIRTTLPLIDAAVSFRNKFRTAQFVSVEYRINSSRPVFEWLFPDSIISGNATILNPVDVILAPLNQTLTLQLFCSSLYKSSALMITGTYTKANNEYINTADYYPSYTALAYLPFNGNHQMNILGHADKYFSGMRMKFILQPSILKVRTNTEINGVRSANNTFNTRVQGKMISGFKRWFNMEISGTMMYIQNETEPETGGRLQQSFRQYLAHAKIKLVPSKKIYLAALYQYYRFISRSDFHSMDIFGNYNHRPQLSFSLTMHNLFNAGSMLERQISANSYGEQRFALRGRYLMVKMVWDF